MARIFLLKGDINRPGYADIPDESTTLRQVIYDIGGGIADGKAFKAVQIGGPSGGMLTAEQLDLPLNFKLLKDYGVRRGNSSILVYSEDRCMVHAVYRIVENTQDEFCGRCVPCREGNRRVTEMLCELAHFTLPRDEMETLLDMGEMIAVTSLCALGKGCNSTLQTAVRAFGDEFEAHLSGHCPLCEAEKRLFINACNIPQERKRLVIDPSLCRGCGRCARNCHTSAISGALKSPFSIDNDKCIKCYTCMENCAFGAIREEELHE